MVGGSTIPYPIYMLLWQPVGPHQRRSTTEVPYPSWSWIGWIGPTAFPSLNEWGILPITRRDEIMISRSTIVTSWYFRDSRSGRAPKRLQDVRQLDHRHSKEEKILVQTLQMIGQEEVIAKTRDLTAHQIQELEEAEVVLLKESSGSHVYALRSECPSDQAKGVGASLSQHRMPDNGLLQFWTESAFFTVRPFQTKEAQPTSDIDPSRKHFKITDS